MLWFKKKDEGNVLNVPKAEQYHTVSELIKRSQPNSVYYTFLILSAVIIAAGLLLKNNAIVIGGMLVAPVMTPILLFALGISILEFGAVRKAGFLMVISFFIVVAVAWVFAKIIGVNDLEFFLSSGEPIQKFVLYYFVALSSGIAATVAWTRKEFTDILPGIAISVSLVPPLSLIGISYSEGDIGLVAFYFWVFVFNLFGMIAGSFLVYLLLKFYQAREEVEKNIDK